MRKEGLRAIQPPRFIPRTTDSKHGKRVCRNLLPDEPKPSRPNAAWTSDITYIPLKGGKWVYLCVWMDLYSREIVSWQLADNMEESLVRETVGKGTSQAKGQTGNDRALGSWRTIFITKNEERDQNVQTQTEHVPRR